MKRILPFLFLWPATAAFAQPAEGVVHYTRTTYWTKMNSQLTYLSKQQKERMAYMFGGRDDWREYTVLYFNDKASKYTHSEEKPDENEGYDWRNAQYIVRRDYARGTLSDIIEMAGKTYLVEDSLHMPSWKILNELKDVAGHICMKAVTEDTLKKQRIVAWFAQDIPVPAGPERLHSLPGLILELDINDGTVTVTASRIEARKLATELDPPKKTKGTRLSETGYQQMLGKFIRDRIKEETNPYWSIRY